MYDAIVIGVSAGGINALTVLFSRLGKDFCIPVIVVQHISSHSDGRWIELLNAKTELLVKEADEKEKILPGIVYVAPPNYHLVIEKNKTFSLTIDERVNFSRPSVDVLFDSAAEAFANKVIGVVLTGSSADGSEGLKRIKELGGLAVVQDPRTAEVASMPAFAISALAPDYILDLNGIAELLMKLSYINEINQP